MLEQEYSEVIRLEKILDAFGRYEEHIVKKNNTRSRNRDKHAEVKETVIEA